MLRVLYQDYLQIRKNRCNKFQFYNCWDQPNEDMYWRQFMEKRYLVSDDDDLKVAIFSVFGNRAVIKKVKADVKLFFSGENLKTEPYKDYTDSGLSSPEIDLALGFEDFEHPKYQRFPLWMDYMFEPDITDDGIRDKCRKLRFPFRYGVTPVEERRFCSMVASHGGDGLRRMMVYTIGDISEVSCAGRFMHNDDSLLKDYNDVKQDYLEHFIFNICPENSNASGYVTEKLFESLLAGCIPVYWGGAGNPEPYVINKDAVIMWDRKDSGSSAVNLIAELWNNPKILMEFISQPRLLPTAEEYIIDTFHSIESKIRDIIQSKTK